MKKKSPMKKKGLIAILADKTQSNFRRTKLIFDKLWAEVIPKVLREKGKVIIPSFGVFVLTEMKEGKKRNPKTGEYIWVAKHKKILFRPCFKLKKQIREW